MGACYVFPSEIRLSISTLLASPANCLENDHGDGSNAQAYFQSFTPEILKIIAKFMRVTCDVKFGIISSSKLFGALINSSTSFLYALLTKKSVYRTHVSPTLMRPIQRQVKELQQMFEECLPVSISELFSLVLLALAIRINDKSVRPSLCPFVRRVWTRVF